MAYKINGDDEQNRIEVKFSSYGQTCGLGVRVKAQISYIIGYYVKFQTFLYQTLYVFSQIKDVHLLLGSC